MCIFCHVSLQETSGFLLLKVPEKRFQIIQYPKKIIGISTPRSHETKNLKWTFSDMLCFV